MKIGFAGSGAMGSGFGYLLHKGGHDVTFMDFWDEHIRAINENGLSIDFNGYRDTVRIPAQRPENVSESFDAVFVFTKAMDLDRMLTAIDHTLTDETAVVCLLNGLGHRSRIARYVPEGNIVMGTTVWSASLEAPGCTSFRGEGPVEVQETAPSGKPAAEKIVRIMKDCGLNGVYSEDVKFTTWRKACVNGTMNSLSALLDAKIAELFASKHTMRVIRRIVEEFAEAARLDGVTLDADEITDYLVNVSETVGAHYPSMHQDITKLRPTEIEYLNGYVARLLEGHGKQAPVSRTITELVHGKEETLGIL